MCNVFFETDVSLDFEGQMPKLSQFLDATILSCHRSKGSDHLGHSWGVLADFWVPNEIDRLNFQHMLLF